MLGSLVVLAHSIDPTDGGMQQANVFSTSLDVNLEKLPDSFKDKYKLGQITQLQPSILHKVDVTESNVTNALPASLLAPIIIKSMFNQLIKQSLYNYKSVFSDRSALLLN